MDESTRVNTASAMRVAIVGAGSAGMAMANQIIEAGARSKSAIDFTIFERRGNVGGIWQYDEDIEPGYLARESEQGSCILIEGNSRDSGRFRYGWKGHWPPGPMFEGLRTNIPSDLMTYRDTPFPSNTHIFPSRQTVQSYLEVFADKKRLASHIRFHTSVVKVKKDDQGKGWLLTSQSMFQGEREMSESFTHIAMCQGRCNTPNIPNITGLDTFEGTITHSAWYRDPSSIKDRRILVVGNGSSGMDIARELTGYITRNLPSGLTPEEWKTRCDKGPFTVYSSWHSLDKAPGLDFNPLDQSSPDWCRKINVLPQIDRMEGKRIYFEDGAVLEDINLIIFATGFLYDNPFLDQTVEPLLSRPLLPPSNNASRTGFPSQTMYNLDDWLLFHSHDESIAFLGLPLVIVPFPLTDVQAMFVVNRWLGIAPSLPKLDTSIPPKDGRRWTSEQESHTEEEPQNGVVLKSSSLVVSHPSDFEYVDSLLRMLQRVDPNAGKEAPREQEYTSDGQGNGRPKGPEERYATTRWRFERRTNGKKLRREALGY